MSFHMQPGDKAVLEALAAYWGTSNSETIRTMLRYFEAQLKLDVR